MKSGKHKHQDGQNCAAAGQKCKACGKIGHFYKVCMTTRWQKGSQGSHRSIHNVQVAEEETYRNELGQIVPAPPLVNVIKVINKVRATQGSSEASKHLKFKVASHPRKPFEDHLIVRVDTGADVNCMNENTFNAHFPEVQLSVFPHETQNFGNSTADISVFRQFWAYLLFKGVKHKNTFIVTDANDCPNLFSHDATFRMGVLKTCYPKSMLVAGD